MNRFFDADDPRSTVWNLQEMLLYLSRVDAEIPRVNPTGYYNDETRAAVSAFQRSRGLSETGEVDNRTFYRVVNDYKEAVDRYGISGAIYPFERKLSGGIVSQEEHFDLVWMLQIMLDTVAASVDEINVSAYNGRYNEETRQNITHFQRISGLEETGQVDQVTWNRLAEVYNSMVDGD